MKALVFIAMLALPLASFAKSETARIEIARGKHALVTLEGPQEAGQFTIWSGPGTYVSSADGTTSMDLSRAFADWLGGPVAPPRDLEVYSVRFYCAAAGENARESKPSHMCYGVRYGYDPAGERGYIQIPPMRDREFPENVRSIYRGVEGSWYRASEAWEATMRRHMVAARAAEAQRGSNYRVREQQYIDTRPPPRAVGATPKLTPKPR